MSRLYNTYLELKKQDKNTYYLFPSGLFYIFLEEDAKIASHTFNLKCNKLNDSVIKCGFPTNSLPKYQILFDQLHMKVKIVSLENTSPKMTNVQLDKLLTQLKNLDLNQMTPIDAWNLLNDIKEEIENE